MNAAAFLIFAASQIADVYTTAAGIKRGAREANPVVAWLMDRLGKAWWVGKLAPSLAIGAGLAMIGLWPVLLAAAAVFFYIAARNNRVAR